MREWEVGERERERSVEGRGGEERRSRRERGRRSGDPGTGGRRRPLFADQPHHGRGVVAWSSTPFGYLQRHINLGSKIVTVYKKSLSFCSVKIEPELANLEHGPSPWAATPLHFFHDRTASLFLSGQCRSASSVLGKSVGDGAGPKGGGKLDLGRVGEEWRRRSSTRRTRRYTPQRQRGSRAQGRRQARRVA
jgi:hypothetical protein